jgi:hypothetical protein
MRYRSLWAVALIIVALLSFANWGGRAQTPLRKTWEYKVVEAMYGAQPASISQQELNKLGAEGWELVETRVTEHPQQGGSRQYRTDYYFKRIR